MLKIVNFTLILDEEFVEDTNQCYMCFDKLDPIKKKKWYLLSYCM